MVIKGGIVFQLYLAVLKYYLLSNQKVKKELETYMYRSSHMHAFGAQGSVIV